MKKIILILFLACFTLILYPQNGDKVTLDLCYEQAILNYPNFKQTDLNNAIYELNIKNTKTNYYPSLNLNGQASWQSDVTKMPIPPMEGFTNPVIPKDWYKLNLDVGQLIYDGGITSGQKDLQDKDRIISNQQIAIEIYQLKEKVNHLFFNILFLQKNVEVLNVLLENLKANIKEAQIAYDNGMLLKSEVSKLKVERVKVEQDIIDKESGIKAIISSLNELTKLNIQKSDELAEPDIVISNLSFTNNRPEYIMLGLQQQKLSSMKDLTKSKRMPKISAFGQAGYGRPGYDMLNDQFDDYYMIGARLNWNIWDWNKVRNEKQILDIQKEIIDFKKQTYNQSLKADLYQRIESISKYEKLIKSDIVIVELQDEIVATALNQFNNGTITSTTYLIELNKLAQAHLGLEAHKLQLIFAKYQYLSAIGEL